MANAWDVGDGVLELMLDALRTNLTGQAVDVHLYQNDYTPVPGAALGDLTESNFAGYSAFELLGVGWDQVTVVDHVAILEHATPAEFERTAAAGVGQPCYGYYLTNALGVLQWVERFETMRTIMPSDILRVTVRYRHQTTANP